MSGDDEKGREGTAHGSNLFFFFPPPLFRPLLSVYLSDLFFFHIYSFLFLICTLSVLLTVSLSLPFIIQYDSSVFLYSS